MFKLMSMKKRVLERGLESSGTKIFERVILKMLHKDSIFLPVSDPTGFASV